MGVKVWEVKQVRIDLILSGLLNLRSRVGRF